MLWVPDKLQATNINGNLRTLINIEIAACLDDWRCYVLIYISSTCVVVGSSVFFVNDDENDDENDENILNYRRRD